MQKKEKSLRILVVLVKCCQSTSGLCKTVSKHAVIANEATELRSEVASAAEL